MSDILVHLMRHGIPARTGLLLGQMDEAPLPQGVARCVQQAQALEFDRVIASDLARASVPAHEVAAMKGTVATLDPRWRELDFGAWTGLAPAHVDAATHARFWEDPEVHAPPEGERWSQLCERVASALAQVDSACLIITHGGAMRAALSMLFHMEHRHVWAFDLPYSCVLSLRLWPDERPAVAQIVSLTP